MSRDPKALNSKRAEFSDPRRLDSYVHLTLLDELFDGRTLTKVLLGKLRKRLQGRTAQIRAAAFYNGLVVFDQQGLHGGGLTYGQDFCRVLLELGLKRCGRLFEFCSGPGYIGYSLLANGFCERLTLSDLNPEAIKVAKQTSTYNGIEHLVNIYLSDGLSQMPGDEKWDLVVGNPPHFLKRDENDNDIRAVDPEWSVHRQFYLSVKRFMNPGGHVIMMENCHGSSRELFEPMIREGGGRVVATKLGTDVRGKQNGLYYLMSAW